MAIDIECEDCGNKYRVSDEKAGGKVRCKECGARIDVPGGDRDLFEDEAPRRSAPKKKRKRGNESQAGVLIGVGAVVAVCVIGVVLFVVMGRGGAAAPQVAQNDVAALPNSNPAGAGLPAASANPAPTTPATPLPSTPNTPAAGGLPASAPATASLPSTTPAGGLPASHPASPTTPAAPATPPPTTPAGVNHAAPRTVANAPKKFGGFTGGGAGGAVAGEDAPAPDNWTVKVDPVVGDVKIDSAKPLNIKWPKGAWNTDVLYPVTPSVFVSLGGTGHNQQTREIWNLATRAKTGTLTSAVVHIGCEKALSPDGQYFAANIILEKKKGVRVWAVKGNKPLGELETATAIEAVMFSGPLQLIGIGKGTVYVWKLPSGELEQELAVDEADDGNAVAISPGGNYLAVAENKSTLKVFDLKSGASVGEATQPFANDFGYGGPEAMAFSPDGAALGLVTRVRGAENVLSVYNVADGKLLSHVELASKQLRFGLRDVKGAPPLQWFPDHSKLLWRGHYILDAKIGGPVWTAPEEEGSSDAPRKLLDEKRILVVAGGRNNPGLKVAAVPLSEIDTAAKIVAEGGEASDAGMPTLLKADTSEATAIAASAAANWTMKPDPAPAASKAVKNSVAVPKQRPSIGGVYITRADVGKAVIWYTDDTLAVMHSGGMTRHQTDPLPGGRGTSAIDVFDLASGKVLNTLPFAYPSAILDVSPDGAAVAVKMTKPKGDRIDVYSTQDGKSLGGWRPYPDKDGRYKDISSALVIDGQYCMTQSDRSDTYMWKLPEGKAIWSMSGGTNFCLSPGGKYLGFQANERYVFMEPRTGELVGEINTAMWSTVCAFHPVGTHLALLSSDTACQKITIVDIAAGKSTGADFYIPHGNKTLQWCGDAHLLVDGQWLIDLKQQKNAWTYEMPWGLHAKTQPDLRHWYVVAPSTFDPNLFLSCASLPEKPALAQIEGAQLPDESLLRPGMQINLQVNLGAYPNLATEVTNNFKAGMQKKGFQVGAGGPYSFVISTSQSNPGGNMEFSKFGGGGGGVTTVPITEVNCEVALQSNGQTIWKTTNKFSNRTFGIQFLKEGEDIGTNLSKRLGESVGTYLKGFSVPSQVFPETAGAGLGKSQLVPGGTQSAR